MLKYPQVISLVILVAIPLDKFDDCYQVVEVGLHG